MDVSARITMKDAANCDKRCEWQNSANQENAERILRLKVIPSSMSSSGRSHFHAKLRLYIDAFAFMSASDEYQTVPLALENRLTENLGVLWSR